MACKNGIRFAQPVPFWESAPADPEQNSALTDSDETSLGSAGLP
jgi:hypothetical protein